MKAILFGALAVILSLTGGTMAYVYREATLAYNAARDRCLDAGGGWVPRSDHSFTGTCRVQTRTPARPIPPSPSGPAL